MESNPYATPTAALTPSSASNGSDEARRAELIWLEQRLYRAASWFILAASSAVLIGGFYTFLGLSVLLRPALVDDWVVVGTILFLGLAVTTAGVAYGFLARHLRRLDGRARIPAIVGASLLLFGLPVFTVGGAVGLWALADAQIEQVLSEEYRQVVARTPHLTRKPTIWIPLLGPLLLLVGLSLWLFVYTAVAAR